MSSLYEESLPYVKQIDPFIRGPPPKEAFSRQIWTILQETKNMEKDKTVQELKAVMTHLPQTNQPDELLGPVDVNKERTFRHFFTTRKNYIRIVKLMTINDKMAGTVLKTVDRLHGRVSKKGPVYSHRHWNKIHDSFDLKKIMG